MKRIDMKTAVIGVILTTLFFNAQIISAQSLYEFYLNTSKTELKKETEELGENLRETFNQENIAAKQREIDFAEYYAGLKKLIFYGAKLATYADYEENLSFARDKEIFKGLPEKSVREVKGKDLGNQGEFVSEKYKKMKSNIKEEIAVYRDMLQLSLDSCQSIMANDFYKLNQHEEYREKVGNLLHSRKYEKYLQNKNKLKSRWEKMATGIEEQLNFWREQPISPEAPILKPEIVAAI